jgi:hypothetical protein
MSRTYKRWIFTKSTEYRPSGILRVGQILSDPFDPASALHPKGPLPIPDDVTAEDSELSGVTVSQASELSAQFGLWADLTGIAAPVGARTEVSMRKAQSQDWTIEKLLSTIITPSNEYVDASLRHGDVPATLKNVWLFKKRLYMLTGVRVVQGARMKSAEERSGSTKLSVQADATSLGAPVTVGTSTEITNKRSQDTAFEGATDFVFAYRLQQIFYYGVNKDPTHEPFKKGETSAAGRSQQIEQLEEVFDDFEVLNVDEDDYEGDDMPGVTEVTVPDFENVGVLVQQDSH